MKLTFEQIVEKFNESEDSNLELFAYGDFEKPFLEAVGNYTIVDRYGGEDKGSEWFKVFHFTEHDVYIRLDAYYSSYEGLNFDYDGGLKEVFPTPVTTIQYLPKKED